MTFSARANMRLATPCFANSCLALGLLSYNDSMTPGAQIDTANRDSGGRI